MSSPPTSVTSTTTTTTTAAPDKEAFQNYLENTGVLDTMTQCNAYNCVKLFFLHSPCIAVLVDLFENPNRPPDAIALFASKLGAIAGESNFCALFFFFFFFFSLCVFVEQRNQRMSNC
jgi:hypothetical protein